MRILFAIPSLEPGGTERQLLYLVRALHGEHQLSILCTRTDGAWTQDALAFTEVHVLDARSGWDFRQQGQALRILRQFRPDVVHSFLFGFDYWINRAARAAEVPVIVSGRRQVARWKKSRHVHLQRMSNRLVDAFVANSRAVASFAAQQEVRPVGDYRLIPNAVDVDAFAQRPDVDATRRRYGIPREKLVVGMVANFSPVKNHAFFLEVARELLRSRANVHFLLVGSGPLHETIRRTVAARGWSDCFTLIAQPAAEDLPGLYRLMDAHVLTSHDEGAPNVVLEAMAAGTPVISNAVGGVPELIQDGVTGLLVAPDNVDAFADAVMGTLNGAATAGRVAAGLDYVRAQHSIAALAAAHSSLYSELLSATGSRRLVG